MLAGNFVRFIVGSFNWNSRREGEKDVSKLQKRKEEENTKIK